MLSTIATFAFSIAIGLFPTGADDAATHASVVSITALERGDRGPAVERLQLELTRRGFRPATVIDGVFGSGTQQAVYAFQKHHGLERDGVFRIEHWALLDHAVTIRQRPDADRVEVDLDKQVLYLVRGGRVTAVIPVSSGNGALYTDYAGREVLAETPEGRFEFYKQRDNLHVSYLGELYKPYYFTGGYAIHGSPHVPTGPASHGCIRVTNADMDWLRPHLAIGMPVYVYGLQTESPPAIAVAWPAAPSQ